MNLSKSKFLQVFHSFCSVFLFTQFFVALRFQWHGSGWSMLFLSTLRFSLTDCCFVSLLWLCSFAQHLVFLVKDGDRWIILRFLIFLFLMYVWLFIPCLCTFLGQERFWQRCIFRSCFLVCSSTRFLFSNFFADLLRPRWDCCSDSFRFVAVLDALYIFPSSDRCSSAPKPLTDFQSETLCPFCCLCFNTRKLGLVLQCVITVRQQKRIGLDAQIMIEI